MQAGDLWLKGGSWIFAGVCLVIAFVLLRLLVRERITLQGSMSYLTFLGVLGGMAVFSGPSAKLAQWLGFTLLSNFFFCTAIALLATLHLRALVLLSKVHMRSIALTQEVAILSERLDRQLAATAISTASESRQA